MSTHFDVLIVGAGLSGIGAAFHLQTRCPGKSYAILEARDAIGGTWDLFRYPGVRSDSDMFTLGYRFRPWRKAKAIADGPSIKSYVQETASAFAIDKKIRFDQRVIEAAWSSAAGVWTLTVLSAGRTIRYTCNFLWMCSGYYRYAGGYAPEFEGAQTFRGLIVHPQAWPDALDYAGKKVAVIGSGATAVTLVPTMAETAERVIMIQRSPTYMISMPGESALAAFLSKVLPEKFAYLVMRWQRIVLQQFMFWFARKRPKVVRQKLLKQTQEHLTPGYDIETHFSPRYNPWDQRLCLVPDADLFEAINAGKAAIETGSIQRFSERGVVMESGREIEADIIITATGLVLEVFGGATVTVDGRRVQSGETLSYKGMMYSDVPNLVSVFGYTNASWTLRADLISEYVCRLINFMDKHGHAVATPVNTDPDMPRDPFFDFSSGYVTRASALLPKQGRAPWRHPQNYLRDLIDLRFSRVDDGVLRFSARPPAPPGPEMEKTALERAGA